MSGSTLQLDKVVEQLVEVRNPQLRSHIITDIIMGDNKLNTAMAADLLNLVMKTFPSKEENISIDNKLFRSKVCKLTRLSQFYHELVKPRDFPSTNDVNTSRQEILCMELVTDLEEVESVLELVDIQQGMEEMEIKLSFSDFLSCFETEGDLSSAMDGFSIQKYAENGRQHSG